jgi:hypothetical protein
MGQEMIEDYDVQYLDRHFQKGNSMRGHAMVLMSLGRIVGEQGACLEIAKQDRLERIKKIIKNRNNP